MNKATLSPWRKRMRAGGLYLASFLATTALSHAQTSQKTQTIPLCSTSYAMSGVTMYVALHAKTKSANTAETFVSVSPPLKAQSISNPAFTNTALLPSLRLVWDLGKYKNPRSVTGTFKLSETLRSNLPRPTGCSIYLGNSLERGPFQMKGIDNVAHNQPFCSAKFYGSQMTAVTTKNDYKVRIHGPYDDDILSFTFDTSALTGFAERARQTSIDLKTDWTSGKCQPILPNPVGSPCFITTAACDVVGLSDDCWELQQLRAFRDDWLLKQNGGAGDVATYYAKAPKICDTLAKCSRGRQVLLALYWTRILPCAVASKLGFKRLTRRWYTQMMSDLSVHAATQEFAA